jgi:biopolymer transport protein ExbD
MFHRGGDGDMARKKRIATDEQAQLQMTPMIDVVFQLLIFFIVTLKQEDILSHLDISRPAPDQTARPPDKQIEELLTIEVFKDGYIMQGRRVPLSTLDRRLTKLAEYSKNISVIIKCTADSPHANLIRLLDICAKADLKNLSVFSM